MHLLALAEVRVVVAEDQEQVDKLVALKDRAADAADGHLLRPARARDATSSRTSAFTDVEDAGLEAKAQPAWLEERVAHGRAGDVAMLCTTSGTTGKPKLARLTHANLLRDGRQLLPRIPVRSATRYVSSCRWRGSASR